MCALVKSYYHHLVGISQRIDVTSAAVPHSKPRTGMYQLSLCAAQG